MKIYFKQKGFTLIELLVVIAIIAILSVIGITIFSGVQKNARDTKRREDVNAIAQAVRLFYFDNKTMPSVGGSPDGAGAINTNPSGWADAFKTDLAAYMPQLPIDPANGNNNCGGNPLTICRYVYSPDMYCCQGAGCSTPPDPNICHSGTAAVYAFLENNSCVSDGDAKRFGFGDSCNLVNVYLKSIDPI